MNCDEFRHLLLTEPLCVDVEFRRHQRICPECSRAAERALRFESALREALEEEFTSEEKRARPRSGSGWVRIARAIPFLLLLPVALWLGLPGTPDPHSRADLGDLVMEHIQSEGEHLHATGTVLWPRLRALFRSLGGDLDPMMGPVSFAGRCVIGGQGGIHLVLPGSHGAVTALFIPGDGLDAERPLSSAGFDGVLLPAAFGTLAVVGESGEPVRSIARRLLEVVRWRRNGA